MMGGLFLLTMIPAIDRLRRFTLGERIESGLLDVLELLIEAAYRRNRHDALRQANFRLCLIVEQRVLLDGN